MGNLNGIVTEKKSLKCYLGVWIFYWECYQSDVICYQNCYQNVIKNVILFRKVTYSISLLPKVLLETCTWTKY